ncbi:peptidoglycan DD-metalloendopeptidase family protein [Mycoplasmatota bacterium]|nr:peptidoglycan DD-metalloendopeptidase family protein [Mycoplasmatota bacterium]
MNKKIQRIVKKNKYRSKFYQMYKKSKKQNLSKNNKDGYRLASFTNKILISICVLLLLLIARDNDKLNFVYEKTLNNMNFVKIKLFVNQKLNGIFPRTNDPNKYVGSIIIDMNNSMTYRDGMIIETAYSAPVESSVAGMVIRIYRDEDLGKVVVIQDILGREYHYGYLDTIEVGLYRSVEYGDILGLGRLTDDMNGEYYLAIKDGNEFLDVLDVVNHEN